MLNKADKIYLRKWNNSDDSRPSYYWFDVKSDVSSLSMLELNSFVVGWFATRKLCLIGLYIQTNSYHDELINLNFLDGIEDDKNLIAAWDSLFDDKKNRRIHYTRQASGYKAVEYFVEGVGFIADCILELHKASSLHENSCVIRLEQLIKKLEIDKLPIYQARYSPNAHLTQSALYCIANHIAKYNFKYLPDDIYISKISRNKKIKELNQRLSAFQPQPVAINNLQSIPLPPVDVKEISTTNVINPKPVQKTEPVLKTPEKKITEPKVESSPKEVTIIAKEKNNPVSPSIKNESEIKQVETKRVPATNDLPVSKPVDAVIQEPIKNPVLLADNLGSIQNPSNTPPIKQEPVKQQIEEEVEEEMDIYDIAQKSINADPSLVALFDISDWE